MIALSAAAFLVAVESHSLDSAEIDGSALAAVRASLDVAGLLWSST